jgi:hypothetical protein
MEPKQQVEDLGCHDGRFKKIVWQNIIRILQCIILIIAIRIIFPEFHINISKSFAKRRKLFNHEKMHSTTRRFGKTARMS